ncbi:hypothetical protein M407DRAFT_34847 [Tulasnella calospora MUT 4182]|uniref:Uncharacterized protein n=1 Tax=Tulasnella calospora MUT 4182 TaxID=1051891 RepID=A0A0C3Q0N5_9AGAM|nr:hypothetical protein M407DRAFT_34847 [Tulasnella calospora MUT 4182]
MVVTLEELLRGVLPVSPELVNVYSFGLRSAPLPLSTPIFFLISHSVTTLHIRLQVRGGAASILQPKDASKTVLCEYAFTIYNEKYISSHPSLLDDISWIEEDDFSDWFCRSRPSPRRSRPQSPEYIEISDSDCSEPSGRHPGTPSPSPQQESRIIILKAHNQLHQAGKARPL